MAEPLRRKRHYGVWTAGEWQIKRKKHLRQDQEVVGEGDLDRYCSDKDPLAGKRTRILCSLTCQETGVEADKIAYVLSGLHGDLTIAATTYWYGVPAALPSSGAGSEFRIIWARL